MELKEYIQNELDASKRGLTRVLNGLSQPEFGWRPACGCNSIGLIMLHLARSEDSFIQDRVQGKPQIWEAEKWYEKLKMAPKETGAHYTLEQVNAFQAPASQELMAYYDAVRSQTMECLKNTPPEGFDRKITMPHFGDITVAGIFSLIARHAAQHVGEMSYLRGLQRGIDK